MGLMFSIPVYKKNYYLNVSTNNLLVKSNPNSKGRHLTDLIIDMGFNTILTRQHTHTNTHTCQIPMTLRTKTFQNRTILAIIIFSWSI